MKRNFLAGFVLSLWAGAVSAEQAPFDWSNLVDARAQTFEDPFADLSYDQLDHLRTIVRANERLKDDGLSGEDRARVEARLAEANAAMTQSGIDVDWLLSQRWPVAERREAAAKAGNPSVDGKVVTLAGFAVPAPPDPDGTGVAYLVPEPGACSHMPPPNANQMVRVRLNGGWTPSANDEPVRLTGRLAISPSAHVIQVVDGPVTMNASFAMEVTRVETLADFRAAASAGTEKGGAENNTAHVHDHNGADHE
jgi:hypothetical protein